MPVSGHLEPWFEANARPGDLVLTGTTDPVSRLIQFVTGSEVSHAAVVTEGRSIVEANDLGHTPAELDEGIYRRSFDEFYERTKLDRVMIRRPIDLDVEKFESAVRFALENSPPFPTSGAFMLNALLLSARPEAQWLMGLAGRLGFQHKVDVALDWLIGFVADGPERAHCSEVATRIFAGSGLHLRFSRPALLPHLRRVIAAEPVGSDAIRVEPRLRGKVASFDRHFRRKAWKGELAAVDVSEGLKVANQQKVVAANEVQKMTIDVAKQRLREAHQNESDIADLILPGDFERAEPFTTVGVLLRDRRGWYEGDIRASAAND